MTSNKLNSVTTNAARKHILDAAVRLSERMGYLQITRDDVADEARCAAGSINRHFGTMQQLRRAIMGEAVNSENLNIIAQGLVAKDTRAQKAPETIRRAALESILI